MIFEAVHPPLSAAATVFREFASSAWLAQGMNYEAGWLVCRDGCLAFVDHSGVVFESSLRDIDEISFPWYYWGQGCRLRVCGETYRLSFTPPGGGKLAYRLQGWQGPEMLALTSAESPGARLLSSAWRAVLNSARDSLSR